MTASPAWRHKLFEAYLANTSITVAAASRLCKTPESTVRLWLKRFRASEYRLEDAPRAGRRRVLDSKAKKAIRNHLTRNQHATISSATQRVQGIVKVSCRTVQRELYERSKNPTVWGQIPCAPISPANVKKRLDATTPARTKITKGLLNKLVFLDAANVWWKKGHIKGFKVEAQHHRAGATKPPCFGYQKIHFYAAIALGPDGSGYSSQLVFVPPTPGHGDSFTAAVFQNKVASQVLAWAKQVYGEEDFYFVQDNAKQHNATSSQKWMEDHNYLLHDHPPQSPDLNRIEKVWAVFKKVLSRRKPQSLGTLFSTMQKEWRNLDPQVFKRFVIDLPHVMARVHAKPGIHDNK